MTSMRFEEVVERYADYVFNVAYRMLGNPHDAQDATQETFISAHRAWPRFRGEAKVTTWLYRIAVNACLMRIRKEKRAMLLTETGYEDQQIPSWTLNPAQATLDSELRQTVQDGLARLPQDLRAAVVLRDVQGLANEEAAQAMGISISALKARLHRGRVLLRKYLEGYLRS